MSNHTTGLHDFTTFILSRAYGFDAKLLDPGIIKNAADQSVADSKYHYDITAEEVFARISANRNELPVYLYRLGRILYEKTPDHPVLRCLHWVMREVCCCELYFSSKIDEGLLILHGLGTVIGSRNTIGKGLTIYQGCTIGHKKDDGKGSVIGNGVTMFANSLILGELTIGDNAVIGSNSLVLKDVPADCVAKGSPAVVTPLQAGNK
ncbi:serine acetyltransferase [Maridesulfovibrio sp.]|uniref:serine O-acetyltransferase n=1 Tax=Maridesulfovibrio sp. TaxID=2795000 RepID=UPI002A18B4B4|nr:serine acetyltransferase [Maridesulfovibrio sp.]